MKKTNYPLLQVLSLLFITTFVFSYTKAQKLNTLIVPTSVNCTELSSLPACTNYILNNSFAYSATYNSGNPNHYTNPFYFNFVPNWANSHGSPQIYDGVNFVSGDPLPPFIGAGWSYLHLGIGEPNPIHAEGIVQKIPKLMPGKTYILSFFRQIKNLPNQPDVDNLDIYAMKCSDYALFNPSDGNYPTPPINSKKIYCETNITDKTWKRVVIKFTVDDNYDMLWIYPRQNNTQNLPVTGLYFSYPQIIDDFTFTAGPTPTAPNSPNCNVLIGPQTPNCSALQGAIFTWTSPSGVQTVVPANDQRISVNTAQSNNVGTWTLSMTFPNFINSNTNCGANAYFDATVVVPACINTTGLPQILNNGYFSANEGCTPTNISITPYTTNNNNCYWWECGGSINLESNLSAGNEWLVNNLTIPAIDGSYNITGIGQITISNNTKKFRHVRSSASNSNHLYNIQLKNSGSGNQQITPPTYVRYVPTFFPTDFIGFYKLDYTLNISTYDAGPGATYVWSIPNTIVTDNDITTPEASVYLPPNAPIPSITGSLTISNSPYCSNGIYNVVLVFDPNLRHPNDSKNKVLFYPNPTTTQLTVSTTNNALIQSVEIGDLFNPIIKRVVVGNNKSSTINVSALLPGIYNCKITTNKGVEYQKLIIKR